MFLGRSNARHRPVPLRHCAAPLGVLAGLLIVAACGEIPEPESFAVSPPTSEEDQTAVEDESESVTAPRSGATTTTQFVPSPSADYIAEIILSTNAAVLRAGADGTGALDGAVAPVSATAAVDDLVGGLVVQRSPVGGTGVGDVVWLRAEGGDPVVVAQTGTRLLDVGYVDGSPSALVLVGSDQVDRIRLVDDERVSMVILEEDEQLLDLSASGGLHALVLGNDACGDLRFYTADGAEVDLNGPGEPNCIVPRRPAYGAVALSPDGATVAYTDVAYRDDGIEVSTELVARELGTGLEYYRQQIGADGDRITAIGFDGERVVYLRESDTDRAATVVDVTSGSEIPIDLTGIDLVDSVSFARLPLTGS